MIIKKGTYHIFLLIFFCCLCIFPRAQTVAIKTDRNQILIGEQIAYELLIIIPSQGYTINFNLPDTIPHFEIIEENNFDTINNNGTVSIHKKIIFTSFDSGAWYIPALPVMLEINNTAQKFTTDSVLINIGYADADSTAALRDIKPIMEVEITNYFWWYMIGFALSLIIIFIFVYGYFNNRKKKILPLLHSAISPFDEAMAALKELSTYDLAIPQTSKKYHTQLGFVLKKYYSRVIETNLLNTTTGDLLVILKEQQVESGLLSSIAESLRIADAVKFAKYISPVSESKKSLLVVKDAMEKIEKSKSTKN